METEAKLAFTDRIDLYDLSSSDFFRKLCTGISDPEPVLLENSYLDTKDMDVTKRGGMIRVRHYRSSGKDSFEFTVKYGGGVSGAIHKRYEWNMKSNDGKFSVETFLNNVSDNDDSRNLLSEAFGTVTDNDLTVICSNSFNRTVYEISYGNSLIEACFDSGIISSPDGSKTDEICELELELIKGDLKDLTALTGLITDKAGCVPFADTKYRRTLALATGR